MSGFQQVDVARNQFDSKGIELALQSMGQNLQNFYSTGTINEIGAIVAYAGAIPPTGWLIADGSAVSRTTFSALFAVIGTTYGVGDGSTTFNLPDLKGRVPVGRDSGQTEFDTLGEKGGHKLMQAHTHTQQVASAGDNGSPYYPTISARNSINNLGASAPTASTGGGDSQNLQPYQVINYIVRYALPASNLTNLIPSTPYKFRAWRSGTQSITSNTLTKVQYNTKEYDDNVNYDNTTNYRYVVPLAGLYYLNAVVQTLAGTTATDMNLAFYKNGTYLRKGGNIKSATYPQIKVSGQFKLNAGDYIEVFFINIAGADSIDGSTTSNTFEGHLIST